MQRANMNFSDNDKLKAMAIVSVFETGKSFGDFAAVAVLDDGAGISYGLSQFTHRSGALAEVLEKYLANSGHVECQTIEEGLAAAKIKTTRSINELAVNGKFINALSASAATTEMKSAQIAVALERYLEPAIEECRRLSFTEPLSLAVIYDSMTHGSWKKIRDRVLSGSRQLRGGDAPDEFSHEQNFIINYITARDAWLASIPRLAATRYRTRFFLNQIKLGNWQLKLPVRVQDVSITDSMIDELANNIGGQSVREINSAVEPSHTNDLADPSENSSDNLNIPQIEAQPSNVEEVDESCLDKVEAGVNAAAARYDQVERIATTVTTRNDAAKSLWTTVIGSVTQTFWALFGLFAGVPREVWLVVALIAAALMLMYLYRQIALGKIREKVNGKQ
jgi:chitosanase